MKKTLILIILTFSLLLSADLVNWSEISFRTFLTQNDEDITLVTGASANADEMIDLKTGEEMTMHSKNPVPFILVKNGCNKEKCKLRSNGVLGNVAPTLLDALNIEKPKDMVLGSLIGK